MANDKCPRCDQTIPTWQPLHLRCLVYRARFLLPPITVLLALPIFFGIRSILVLIPVTNGPEGNGGPEEEASVTATLAEESLIPTSTATKIPTATPSPIPTSTPTPRAIDFSWQYDVVDASNRVGVYNSLAMDVYNNVHIAYFDDARDNLKYALGKPFSWGVEILESRNRVGLFPSLDIDKNNRPIIAYYDIDTKWIKLVRESGTGRVYENVVYVPSVLALDLKLDNRDAPHIIYLDSDLNFVIVDWEGNEWIRSYIGYSTINSTKFDFSIDDNNDIHLSYYNNGLIYANRSGGKWEEEILEIDVGSGIYSSVAVDHSGQVHILYSHEWGSSLRYASRADSSWEVQDVETRIAISNRPEMDIDEYGGVHLGYIDSSTGVLKYAYGSNGVWNVFDIDRNVDGQLSLALDDKGNPYISYYNQLSEHLRLAWAISPAPDSAQDSTMYEETQSPSTPIGEPE